MARPKRENADYFSHDSDMRNDPKVKYIRNAYGFEGYALYCMMLEYLTSCDNFSARRTEKDKKLLCGDFGLSFERMEEIISDMIDVELFTLENEILYSNGLKKRLQQVIEKREKMKLLAEKRRNKQKEEGCVRIVSEAETMQSKVKESKVKKSKEKERESNTPTPTDFSKNVFLSDQEKKALEQIYGSSATQDYINRLGTHIASKGDKYDSHYATILLWMKQDKVRPSGSPQTTSTDPPQQPLTDEQKQTAREAMQKIKSKLTS